MIANITAYLKTKTMARAKPARGRVRIKRYFSRLQTITPEDAPYYSMRSVRKHNHISYAYITLLTR